MHRSYRGCLLTLQGVKNVDVDLEGKTVSVTFNDAKTSEEAIKMAVADAGYMAGNFTNPIVQESLPVVVEASKAKGWMLCLRG